MVVGLVEAVALDQLAHWGQVGFLQHGSLGELQGRVHGEEELGSLVRPVIYHLVDAGRDVTRVGPRV